ncbi:MAG: redox-sensing transcriptional repressor Rex [Peptoniphilaceae bacterium]|nr:redox-sensing transcriptional repressor Rex [Peptoniphilaceae bacterium]MDY6085723.1 redox-sensing transcriptional repressor Rex [Peptoniphilaceae bacterium]
MNEKQSSNAISNAVIRRLPKYLRYLTTLTEQGVERISSQKLSEITGFTASQIRQDLNHFGGFGQQGYGYNVQTLHDEIVKIIGLNRIHRVAIAGAGHLGVALANSRLFRENRFHLVAIFDVEPEVVGQDIGGVPVKHIDTLEETIKEERVDIFTITTPKDVAQDIANRAVNAGVKGIWNYAQVDLKLPKKVVLENVYLNESLHSLVYYMGNLKDYKTK